MAVNDFDPLSCGSTGINDSTPYAAPYYNWHYTNWPSPTFIPPNKHEQAFAVLKALMTAKKIKFDTVDEFCKTLEKVKGVL